MNEVYQVPLRKRAFRRLVRPTFRGLFHILSHVIVTGRENVPKGTPYIIAINHVSLYDPPFALAFWPEAAEVVAALDIWRKTGQSTLVSWYGGIAVDRGVYNRQALSTFLSVLKSGRPLLIAPEGGRSHALGMRRAQPGVGYLVEKAGVPVIPVGIVGATDDFLSIALRGRRPVLEMRIGPAITFAPRTGLGASHREERQNIADLIMVRLAALLPDEYRGFYAERPQLASQAA